MVFSMVAELERDFISDRTKAGLKARAAQLVGFILTPTVVKDSILATGLTKVYHHGFDN